MLWNLNWTKGHKKKTGLLFWTLAIWGRGGGCLNSKPSLAKLCQKTQRDCHWATWGHGFESCLHRFYILRIFGGASRRSRLIVPGEACALLPALHQLKLVKLVAAARLTGAGPQKDPRQPGHGKSEHESNTSRANSSGVGLSFEPTEHVTEASVGSNPAIHPFHRSCFNKKFKSKYPQGCQFSDPLLKVSNLWGFNGTPTAKPTAKPTLKTKKNTKILKTKEKTPTKQPKSQLPRTYLDF